MGKDLIQEGFFLLAQALFQTLSVVLPLCNAQNIIVLACLWQDSVLFTVRFSPAHWKGSQLSVAQLRG